MTSPIPVVDLFAGPGGLGEGFNSLRGKDGNRVFKTLVSVEKEASAHRTLTLRAFYRLLCDTHDPEKIASYNNYLRGGEHPSKRDELKDLWQEACSEALQLELGNTEDNERLEDILSEGLDHDKPWVLIGGPPCQAYSLVGRSRNMGIEGYRAEDDKRHFLYKEYLNVIAGHRPAIFVMENVRGILSSKVSSKFIFPQILDDLHNPTRATGITGPQGISHDQNYTIFSLVDKSVRFPRNCENTLFSQETPLKQKEYGSFIVKAERYGIPQARHRVILVGIRNDLVGNDQADIANRLQLEEKEPVAARTVLEELPVLRSALRPDNQQKWFDIVFKASHCIAYELRTTTSDHLTKETRLAIAKALDVVTAQLARGLPTAANSGGKHSAKMPLGLKNWFSSGENAKLEKWWSNHQARSHMETDLWRYLYCAAFAKAVGRSAKGHKEIYLPSLTPDHANWKTGKFADRFRVVVDDQPSRTVVSHISKDGHYFIHPDPLQCRSLTVREAARLQTFPDNYFFEGNRTEQFVQVGNAVPPMLAASLADKLHTLLEFMVHRTFPGNAAFILRKK